MFTHQLGPHLYDLVGGFNPLENMKVNWDDDIPNIDGKIKVMFQSPPTSDIYLPRHVSEPSCTCLVLRSTVFGHIPEPRWILRW